MQDDSDLKAEWDALQSRKRSEQSAADQIKIEEQRIEMKFESIIERRRQGIMTDTTRMDQAREAVECLSKFNQIEMHLSERECPLTNPRKFCWWWRLVIEPGSVRDDERFRRFIDKATDELFDFPFVLRFCDDRSYWSFPEIYWIIDTMIWSGPPDLRHLRRYWGEPRN